MLVKEISGVLLNNLRVKADSVVFAHSKDGPVIGPHLSRPAALGGLFFLLLELSR